MDDINVLEERIENWEEFYSWIEDDEANRARYRNYQENTRFSKMPYLRMLMEYHTDRRIA